MQCKDQLLEIQFASHAFSAGSSNTSCASNSMPATKNLILARIAYQR